MKTLRWALIAAAIMLPSGGIAATTPVDPLPAWQSGIGSDLAFEGSAFLRHTAYQKPDRTADQAAPSGAYGPLNRGWEHIRRTIG